MSSISNGWETMREQIAVLRARNQYWRDRARRLERSRDMWKTRAMHGRRRT